MYKPYAIIAVLVLVVAAAAAYFLYKPQSASMPQEAISTALPKLAYVSPPVPKLERAAPRTPPQGYKEFRNEFYWFQMLYPANMTATLKPESGSAATITFEEQGHAKDFELYVVPYGEQQITETRFKLDEPSGVMNEPREITVGGVTARFFYGKDAALGETAEVWFINKGFLYEMVTTKANATVLIEILKGWMFL